MTKQKDCVSVIEAERILHTKKTINNESISVRILLVLTITLVPYSLFLSFTLSGNEIDREIIASLSGLILFSFSCSYVLLKLKNIKLMYSICAVIASVFACVWIWVSGGLVTALIYTLLLYFIMHRTQALTKIEDIRHSLHKDFKIDSILIVFVQFILWWTQLGVQSLTYEVTNRIVSSICMVALVLYLTNLLVFENIDSNKSGIKIVFFSLIGVSLLFVFLLNGEFEIFFLVIGIIVSIPLLPQLRTTFFGYLITLIINVWLFSHFKSSKTSLNQHQILNASNFNHSPSHFSIVYIVVINLIVILLFTVLKIKNNHSLSIRKQKGDEDTLSIVSRVWVRKKNSHVVFLKTDDPIRLKYQKWLRQLQAMGIALNATDTARGLLRRMGHKDSDPVLISKYEETRYKSHE